MAEVLVIEDSPELRALLVQLFEDEGYRTEGARNGPDGLRLILQLEPQLVVCDVMLPSMDGYAIWQACESIRRQAGRRFMFISAGVHTSPVDEAPLLPKPFDLEHLVSTARALMGPTREWAVQARASLTPRAAVPPPGSPSDE